MLSKDLLLFSADLATFTEETNFFCSVGFPTNFPIYFSLFRYSSANVLSRSIVVIDGKPSP